MHCIHSFVFLQFVGGLIQLFLSFSDYSFRFNLKTLRLNPICERVMFDSCQKIIRLRLLINCLLLFGFCFLFKQWTIFISFFEIQKKKKTHKSFGFRKIAHNNRFNWMFVRSNPICHALNRRVRCAMINEYKRRPVKLQDNYISKTYDWSMITVNWHSVSSVWRLCATRAIYLDNRSKKKKETKTVNEERNENEEHWTKCHDQHSNTISNRKQRKQITKTTA